MGNDKQYQSPAKTAIYQNQPTDGNLYKILIVDDEEPIRLGLKYSINWKEVGFRAADTASNFQTAIELYNYNIYDVVITDIRMPEKNGFELIRALKAKNPNIKIVVISGYDSFDYALEAIRSEVDDYILKPIKKNSIETTFNKLKNKLDQERNANSHNNLSKQVIKSYFLNHLVQNDYKSKETILSEIEQFEIVLPDNNMRIITVKFDNLNQFINTYFIGNIEAIESLIKDNIGKHFPDTGKNILTTFIGDYYILLVEDDETDAYINVIRTFLDKIKTNYKIGIGKSTKSIDYIAVSYQESIEAIHKNTDNIDFNQNKSRGTLESSKLLLLHKHIVHRMENGRFDEIPKIVDDIFEALSNSDNNWIYNWTINSLHEILEYFDINKIQKDKFVYNMNFIPANANNLTNAAKTSYLDHLKRIEDILKSFTSTPNQELVKKTCEIVETDFADKNLTLYNIADSLNISYGYLCTIFKQITGNNFTDYLISVRMKNAKKMILENKYKMFEIADLIGYETARYFAATFKKYYGVTPSDYKKRLGGV